MSKDFRITIKPSEMFRGSFYGLRVDKNTGKTVWSSSIKSGKGAKQAARKAAMKGHD